MRFIKNILFIFIIILAGCTKPIHLKDAKINRPGYFSFGDSPERNFYLPISIGDSLELQWTAGTHGSFGNTSITIYDEYIFVPDLSGRIYCFDRLTGKELGFEDSKGEIASAVIINNSTLIFLTNELKEYYSTLYYFNFIKGEYLEEIITPGKCINEMIKEDDGIILLTEQGNLLKYNFQGDQIWAINTKDLSPSSPAASDKLILFGNIEGDVIAVNSSDGSIIYKKQIGNGFEAGVTISGVNGFIGDNKGIVYSFNIKTGKVNWSFDTGSKIKSSPVLNEHHLIIGNLSGEIFALSKEEGYLIWNTNTGGIINSTPLLFNDYLLQPDEYKKLWLIDVQSGELTKSIKFDGRMRLSPVFYEDFIYLGIDRGDIFAFKPVNVK